MTTIYILLGLVLVFQIGTIYLLFIRWFPTFQSVIEDLGRIIAELPSQFPAPLPYPEYPVPVVNVTVPTPAVHVYTPPPDRTLPVHLHPASHVDSTSMATILKDGKFWQATPIGGADFLEALRDSTLTILMPDGTTLYRPEDWEVKPAGV